MDSDEHRSVQELMPWYVTGRLEAAESERVEAHLVACAECRAEAATEARLEAEVARLPLDVERGWAEMRTRLANGDTPEKDRSRTRSASAWAGWGVAAALAVTAGAAWLPQRDPAEYRALGEAPAAPAAAGNIVVVFLPETTEQRMRGILKVSGARLVDGPTAANGYVLHVTPARRAAALAALRADRAVVVAEPIGRR